MNVKLLQPQRLHHPPPPVPMGLYGSFFGPVSLGSSGSRAPEIQTAQWENVTADLRYPGTRTKLVFCFFERNKPIHYESLYFSRLDCNYMIGSWKKKRKNELKNISADGHQLHFYTQAGRSPFCSVQALAAMKWTAGDNVLKMETRSTIRPCIGLWVLRTPYMVPDLKHQPPSFMRSTTRSSE